MTMELKDALELVLRLCDVIDLSSEIDDRNKARIKEAARLLREGSEKEEHVDDIPLYRCNCCKAAFACFTNRAPCIECGKFAGSTFVDGQQTYTTHHEIRIIEVTSDPTFVEIGGSDE